MLAKTSLHNLCSKSIHTKQLYFFFTVHMSSVTCLILDCKHIPNLVSIARGESLVVGPLYFDLSNTTDSNLSFAEDAAGTVLLYRWSLVAFRRGSEWIKLSGKLDVVTVLGVWMGATAHPSTFT